MCTHCMHIHMCVHAYTCAYAHIIGTTYVKLILALKKSKLGKLWNDFYPQGLSYRLGTEREGEREHHLTSPRRFVVRTP